MGILEAPEPLPIRALSPEARHALGRALHNRGLRELTGRLRKQTAVRMRALRESDDPASLLVAWWGGQQPTELNGGTNIVQHALEGNAEYVWVRIHYRPTEYMVSRTSLAEVVSSERTIQGLSRIELAERAGVTVADVNSLEGAEPFETPSVVWPILRVLDIQPTAVPAPGIYEEHGRTPGPTAIRAQDTGMLFPSAPPQIRGMKRVGNRLSQ
jgi:transcriptional regulator with XRE-family HTH domain